MATYKLNARSLRTSFDFEVWNKHPLYFYAFTNTKYYKHHKFCRQKMIFVFYANLFLLLDDLFLGSDCLHSFQKWRMWMVPAGVERIVDGEGEVVVVQLHQGWDQHLAAAEGPVGKLVSLEFKATTQCRHAEVQELKKMAKISLKNSF